MLEILLVDDEPATRLSLEVALREAGHRVTEAADGAQALALASEVVFDVAICDLRLPLVDGFTLFRHLRRESPATAIILMTAYGRVEEAVTALREGAFDYVTKPFDSEEFTLRVIGRIAERYALRRDLEQARAELVAREVGATIVAHSPVMVRLLERVDTIAQSDANVLITGETGTGKELVAHTLHARSARRLRPFVTFDCAAFTEDAIDGELFGAPAGEREPRDARRGKLRAAHGGTLFLDEVARMPLPTQGRLLRALNERSLDDDHASGASLDVRVISATERDLAALVAAGAFREELLLSLDVVDIALPPLRERKGDMALLLQHFLKRLTPLGKIPPGITPRAWGALAAYSFPGNVRELAHAVERALALAHGSEIDLEHLPPHIVEGVAAESAAVSETVPVRLRPLSSAMKEYERQYLVRALHAAGGRRGRAAELLGISRKNLWEKLRQHGISEDELHGG